MMPGNAECIHTDGEFCRWCYPKVIPPGIQSTANTDLVYDIKLSDHVAVELARLETKIDLQQRQISELINQLTKIANWCYREK